MDRIDWNTVAEHRLPQMCGMNAGLWASAFCEIAPIAKKDDFGLMVGWFANAIERARIECEHADWRVAKIAALEDALGDLLTAAKMARSHQMDLVNQPNIREALDSAIAKAETE